MSDQPDWVVVLRTSDQVEAELVKGLLTTSGIPVVMEARGFKALAAILGHGAGGELLLKVPPDLAQLARDLLNAETEAEPEE